MSKAGAAVPQYVLKGAVADPRQLAHRAAQLKAAGLPVSLELHTFGARDLHEPRRRREAVANVARLRAEHGAVDLTVHIPPQDVATVTAIDFDRAQVEDTIGFAQESGAGRVVLHRYWGMVYGQAPQRSDRADATAAFAEAIKALSRAAGAIMLLVENVGHYSLLPRGAHSFMAGPLDHFFPWEIAAFRRALRAEGIHNVEPFVDVAHATLSANLFNWRRAYRAQTEGDARYCGVLDSDLDQTERLHPFDFVDAAMPWLHLSDSVYYDAPSRLGPAIPLDALISEGLEIGIGNLPWARLAERLGYASEANLVLEVEPGPGETQVDNEAQVRSLVRLRATLRSNVAERQGPEESRVERSAQ